MISNLILAVFSAWAALAFWPHADWVSSEAVEFLVRDGYHRSLGARPMRGAVERSLQLTPEALNGSPMEVDYLKLSPTPDEFPNFLKRVIAMDLKPYDFGARKLKATKAPIFFIHGDADGVRLDHIAEMFRLKGNEIFGDMRPRSESRLAVLPNTTHLSLMEKADLSSR